MAEVKWIKIVVDIFDDEKIRLIESMPDGDALIVIWIKLLCLAGKQNNHGVFMINDRLPYTEEMFATIFNRNISTVKLALSTFEKFGMIEIYNNTVCIPNWEKHQSLDALERKREYQKEWVKNKRAKQKLLCESNVDVDSTVDSMSTMQNKNKKEIENKNINNNGHSTIEQDKPVRVSSAEFEKLWSMYPRKEGKKEAMAAYQRAIKHGTTTETIEEGINRYNKHIRDCRIEKRYIKKGSTYFNQESWNDVYDDAEPTATGKKSSYDLSKVIPAIPTN